MSLKLQDDREGVCGRTRDAASSRTNLPALLPRVAAGDETAVGELYQRYGQLVRSLARRYGHPDAQDAEQEIFVRAWRSAAAYDPAKGSEATFIGTIARHFLIDNLRSRSRQQEVLCDDLGGAPADEPREEPAEVVNEANSMSRCLAGLSERQAVTLRMVYGSGLTLRAISRQTGWSIPAIKSAGRAGLQRLRQIAIARAG